MPRKQPQHEKLVEVQDKSQAIGEFIEWLASEKEIYLANWVDPCPNPPKSEREAEWREQHIGKRLVRADFSIERLLAEFFEIDLDALELEKLAMLDELRAEYENRCPTPKRGHRCPRE